MESPFNIFVRINRKSTEMFCTWPAYPQALARDALTISFENMHAFVYPPIYPIPKILQYIREFWFLHQSKYQQKKPQIYHNPQPLIFNLNDSLLSTEVSNQNAHKEKLTSASWRKCTHKITPVNSKSLIAGAIQWKLIHI